MSHLNDYLIPCKNKELDKAWTYGDPLGGGLPEVTSADNGKVLAVVDGAWSKADSSGGVFVVNITSSYDEEQQMTVYHHDADINDIINAWNNGKFIKTIQRSADLYEEIILYGFCYKKDGYDYVAAITYRPQYVSQAGGWVRAFQGVQFWDDGLMNIIEFVD